MTQFLHVETFDQWRVKARALLAAEVEPAKVHFSGSNEQPLLFDAGETESFPPGKTGVISVPTAFLELARCVACHRAEHRWELLYRTLWRITHGERQLLEIVTDDDVHALHQMQKAVTRDVHKMKAFVRFRHVAAGQDQQSYIAWHRPDHRIVRLAAPFFARRFKAMNWSILTPDESVVWDQNELHYGPGVPAQEAPEGDDLEELWKTYYASIFNPARVKVAMMKREMPVRHWPTLPETELIPELLRQASTRVAAMIQQNEGFAETAAHYLPKELNLESLASAAECCRACDLYRDATQVVFGQGRIDARVVIVGEQPGDQEDRLGRPFVGPAGKLLDSALERAGVNRDQVYITNVVKHFKFTQRGGRRLHKKPDSREIFACRPWLEAELATIRPEVVIALGATAAGALFGRDFRITQRRGQVIASDWCKRTIATWHPAAILRMPDPTRREQMESQLVADLGMIRE